MKQIIIKHKNKSIRVDYAETFFDKARGLMFAMPPKDKGLLIDCKEESRIGSTIHMLFVFFPLDILWLNKKKQIVYIKTVFPFTPLAIPKKPAKYVLELPKGYKIRFKINDKLKF